ncbi:hypothetical protein C2E25_07115 [Geothermobacter hydrogeniphilus]|uniref:C-type cytochrome biogenesis protein CcmI n=1 Tax=Geothermobacter hydrogeniphilus TaxID=1969733 RepID=A0A2K2HB37_9BACT|nr:hypothetical protein [Geothermobacter hydrogeniphilus]PNU20481.1 hypothetical protein C2E25_07115 [Geothermobacter hydrogeniphilus]
MEIATLLLISLLLMVYTLLPVFRPATPLVREQNPLERWRQALEQEKKTNLKAIRDIDFELATGKISAEDHEELRTLYSLRAADAIAAWKRLREDHD